MIYLKGLTRYHNINTKTNPLKKMAHDKKGIIKTIERVELPS